MLASNALPHEVDIPFITTDYTADTCPQCPRVDFEGFLYFLDDISDKDFNEVNALVLKENPLAILNYGPSKRILLGGNDKVDFLCL